MTRYPILGSTHDQRFTLDPLVAFLKYFTYWYGICSMIEEYVTKSPAIWWIVGWIIVMYVGIAHVLDKRDRIEKHVREHRPSAEVFAFDDRFLTKRNAKRMRHEAEKN